MKKHIATLKETATQLQGDPGYLDWPRRVALERAIFALAKETASLHLGFNLVGLNEVTFRDFVGDSRTQTAGVSKQLILLAFQIRRKLTFIASTDPYLVYRNSSGDFVERGDLIRSVSDDIARLIEFYELK
ncbi:MAG TPA: hypothetical protein VIV60_28000 [Polyangiaceae bacterium]